MKLEKEIELNRKDENNLYLLGAYQIAGGIYGGIKSFILLFDFISYPISQILLIVSGISLFIYSTFCGYLIIKRRFLKGLNFSIFNQILQIIGIGILGYIFKFASGFFGGLTMDLTNDTLIGVGLDFSIIHLALGSNNESIFLTINIFAILILGFILKMKGKIEKQIIVESNQRIE